MLSRLYGVLLPFFVSFIVMIIALPLTTLIISGYKHYVLHEPFASKQT